jgi:hypothetical protein
MTINAEEGVEDVVEDVGRSPLPQELYQSGGRGEENGAKRRWWLSRVVWRKESLEKGGRVDE